MRVLTVILEAQGAFVKSYIKWALMKITAYTKITQGINTLGALVWTNGLQGVEPLDSLLLESWLLGSTTM